MSGTHFYIFIQHTFEKNLKPLARPLTDLYPIRSHILVFRNVFINTFIELTLRNNSKTISVFTMFFPSNNLPAENKRIWSDEFL